MSPELVKAAAANLKRRDGWQLRDAHNMPQGLVPAHLMLKEEVDELFSAVPGSSVVRLVSRANHKTAVVRYTSSIDPTGWLFQIYVGKLIRSGHLVVGKLGCVELIRSRLADELEFDSGIHRLSNEALAGYLSEFPESEMRFLDRLNIGQAVSEPHLKRMCDKLHIDMYDLAFSVPTVYKRRELVNFQWTHSIWAEPWNEWVDKLVDGFVEFDVPLYNIYFIIQSNPTIDDTSRKLHMAIGHVYNYLVSFWRAQTPFVRYRSINPMEGLHELGFDCWVSYQAGLRHGDPDTSETFSNIGRKRVGYPNDCPPGVSTPSPEFLS